MDPSSEQSSLPPVTSKTPQIEDVQQRYISALENRILALERQEKETKSRNKNGEAGTETSSTPKENGAAETPTEPAKDSGKDSKDGKDDKDDKDDDKSDSKLLKNVASVQAYKPFFGKVKILARRYSKNEEKGKEEPQGKEELVTDVEESSDTKDAEKDTEQDKKPQYNKAPITLTLGLNEDDYIMKATVRVNDPELQALLQIFFAHYPGFGPDLEVFTIDCPFEPFVQSWQDLRALAKCETDGDSIVVAFKERLKRLDESLTGWPKRFTDFASREDGISRTKDNLNMLLDLMFETVKRRAGDQSLPRILDEETSLTSRETVNYEILWTVYKPGDIVISRPFLDEPQAFIVHESMESAKEKDGPTPHWRLVCWSYDWNGKTFHRVPVELRIDFFKGIRHVRSLPVVPFKYVSDDEKRTMEERGRRFREICLRKKGLRTFEYSGEAILRASGIGMVTLPRVLDNDSDNRWQSPWESFGQFLRELTHGADFTNTVVVEIDRDEQVMVDTLSFRDYGPGKHYRQKNQLPVGTMRFWNDVKACRCSICQQNPDLNENKKAHYDLEPDQIDKEFSETTQYLLCPPRVLGYHISRKRWVELKVTEVKDAQQRVDPKAFNRLQMGSPKSKELLRSLVVSHWDKKRDESGHKVQDLMKGKGESLVVLLYGPPGVGKTLTAESIGLATGRPLLYVTVVDIGLQPEQIEENLSHVFRLAASWEAIILFDEADVFLESRSGDTADLQRNALVSELLRVLEYYDGILILTTNRLKRFDHAVMSRINLAIRYLPLSNSQKKTIFTNFLNDMDPETIENRAQIDEWIRDEDTWEMLEKINGRQIRNILFSAAKMASEKQGGKLTMENIRQLALATRKFSLEINTEMEASRIKNEPSNTTM